ncbi:hypothetical protein [Delftia tsuruhatensis]|uniref:hypothetical protein n=1 Tax=Delftia tsuruhatensis TaxID=180282 RepID=UPI002449A2A7|nr:hypothetical protein [Delftia tsuruhatensis]MDH0423539.1 hypothetical protein [Delftia tsuruhatensis]
MQAVDSAILVGRMPSATLTAPHAQLHWIFSQVEAEQDNPATAAMCVYARNKYLDFICQTSAYYAELTTASRFELSKYWEADALIRFNRWLDSQELASKTKYAIYKSVRTVMDFAYAMRVLEAPVYHAPMFKGVIETEQRTAYPPEQQEFINAEIARWMSLAISVVQGYVPTGKGIPYRATGRMTKDGGRIKPAALVTKAEHLVSSVKSNGSGISIPLSVEGVTYCSISQAAAAYGVDPATAAKRLRSGCTPEQAVGILPAVVPMKDERALLWMFENEYDCKPLEMLLEFKSRGMGAVATDRDLRRCFMKWGVWPHIDDRLVLPLAVELAMLTGLNVESLRSLTLTSYVPAHPLTHQAAIRFNKERAGSANRSTELELHLSTLELEEVYIDGDQVEKVHRLILLIIAVTSKIRHFASDDIKEKLFIFEDVEASRREGRKVVVDYDPKGKVGVWYRRFKNESGFADTFGESINFNVAKCRPTLVTNMVLEGASMTQIQAVLTHSDLQSTTTYLSERQLRPLFNKTMSEALTEISQRSKAAAKMMAERKRTMDSQANASITFHETLSGVGCRDPFNPSDNIRAAAGYVPGSKCKFWNMCLLCDSSLVTEHSLPKLIVYGRKVKEAIAFDSPAVQPKALLLKQVDSLIDGILEVDAIFPEAVIETAKIRAASLDDVLADMLIYQGV